MTVRKLFLLSLSFLLLSCSKAEAKSNSVAKKTEEGAMDSPEITKLNTIFKNMNDEAKKTIISGNKEEFLNDLKIVLNEEKEFSSNDIDLLYLIDKKNKVGADYVPANLVKLVKNNDFSINRNDLSLRPEAYENLKILSKAAKKDGLTLLVSSTYRSYEYQNKTFNKWVEIDGLEEAERESARPGTSQHQLGTAIDFGSIDYEFAETEQGIWLSKNAYKYGWSLSFPQGYEDVTGYRFECWHYRFIGKQACLFQKKWFSDIQQYMIEFINSWKNSN
ncbi:MAG: M15 family metallopeptidase [Treponema sp.]|jgi:zinc D-Ala-D-Ala carboxypeptidase|nr:M15 family metallopeptidase [Treponema sp.]